MIKRSLTFFFGAIVLYALNAAFGADGDRRELDPPMPVIVDPMNPTESIVVDGETIRLEDGLDLSGKDLSNAHIYNRTLHNVDFSNSRFSKADLSQTRFENCSFRGAVLDGACLDDATFNGCDFEDASFNHTSIFYLSRQQLLSSIHMKTRRLEDFGFYGVKSPKDVDFSDFYFENVWGLNAVGCRFDNAYFKNCNVVSLNKEQLLSTKNYQKREFVGMSLYGAPGKDSFAGVDLSGFEFGDFTAGYYDFTGADFTDANFKSAQWIDCSGLTKEQITSTANWKNGRLLFRFYRTDVDWSNADFSNVVFPTECRLSGDMTNAVLADAKFEGIDALSGCSGITRKQIQSTWNWKRRDFCFDLARSSPDWSGADFSSFKFYTRSDVGRGSVAGADFTDAQFFAV